MTDTAKGTAKNLATRLFVPLKGELYAKFAAGDKDIELRGTNDQFNIETVVPGRSVEIRRGYSTNDSIWGVIEQVWTFDEAEEIIDELDHERIRPESPEKEFIESVDELLGKYDRYIAFEVNTDRMG